MLNSGSSSNSSAIVSLVTAKHTERSSFFHSGRIHGQIAKTIKVEQFSTFLCSVASPRVHVCVYELEILHERITLFARRDECKACRLIAQTP